MPTRQEGGHLQAREAPEKLNLPTIWSQTSSLQNYEEINFCCLTHLAGCILWRQPEQTDALGETILGMEGGNEKWGYELSFQEPEITYFIH